MPPVNTILGTMTFSNQVNESASLEMLNEFCAAGHRELDTAHAYNDGKTEALLGTLIAKQDRHKFYIAGKVNPWNENGLQPLQVKTQLNESLARLNTDYVDLLYLHSPDLNTPIIQTLKACWELYRQNKFKHFGLSNYASWQVAEIAEICSANGWMKPEVYQGMYNALTRDVESELFPCLENYAIRFYVYNPLAGGLLTGKYNSFERIPEQGRFARIEAYQGRYWKQEYFNVLEELNSACAEQGINPSDAALRWLYYHSKLSADKGDGIILGASKVEHLQSNLKAAAQGPLPAAIVEVLEQGWEVARPVCIKYFRP